MSEAWRAAWEQHKDELAEDVHKAWMAAKLSHGFADHPWKYDLTLMGAPRPGDCFTFSDEGRRCRIPLDRHHTDMIPFADLSPEIKQYDYDTALAVFPRAFEIGVKTVFDEMDARGMYP